MIAYNTRQISKIMTLPQQLHEDQINIKQENRRFVYARH
uniref:Uncharacterized protein n=1 Tax=Anguilla anguilla TaxID=7936 RepID=A0A0E9UN22_ANGAN